jgi:hypothetical protein
MNAAVDIMDCGNWYCHYYLYRYSYVSILALAASSEDGWA